MPGIMSNQPCFRQETHPLLQLSHRLYLQSSINDLISLGPRSLSVCLSGTGQGNLHLDKFAENIFCLCVCITGGIYDETRHFSNTRADFQVVLCACVFCCHSNFRWGLCCRTLKSMLTLMWRIPVNNHYWLICWKLLLFGFRATTNYYFLNWWKFEQLIK